MTTTHTAGPSTFRVSWDRSTSGHLLRVSVFTCRGADSALVATWDDDEGALTEMLRRAAEAECSDPHDGKLPGDAAVIRQALAEYGIETEDQE